MYLYGVAPPTAITVNSGFVETSSARMVMRIKPPPINCTLSTTVTAPDNVARAANGCSSAPSKTNCAARADSFRFALLFNTKIVPPRKSKSPRAPTNPGKRGRQPPPTLTVPTVMAPPAVNCVKFACGGLKPIVTLGGCTKAKTTKATASSGSPATKPRARTLIVAVCGVVGTANKLIVPLLRAATPSQYDSRSQRKTIFSPPELSNAAMSRGTSPAGLVVTVNVWNNAFNIKPSITSAVNSNVKGEVLACASSISTVAVIKPVCACAPKTTLLFSMRAAATAPPAETFMVCAP